jgi:hypothetical protein
LEDERMGGGFAPGSRTASAGEGAIDDGTLPRIGSPVPGAIGLGGKGGGTKGASIGESVASYATRSLGQRVGDGECFALADRALRNAGAKSAADYGPVVPDGDYVWGTQVSLSGLRPGDVVQFRDYSCRIATEIDSPTETRTEERVEERPHHTAVVERVGRDGAVTVIEQNIPPGSPVVRTQLYFAGGQSASGGRTTTITVRGTVWFYTPQAR